MGQGQRYEITYHPLVVDEVASLDSFWHEQILEAIENKLLLMPEVFGKPLRNSLAGFRTMRVGDYRVIFEIKKKVIYVISIRHRSDGYRGIEKRK